ncbi:hypothetical protein ACFY36_35800 [Actinoplanes sp. NPDC000266]
MTDTPSTTRTRARAKRRSSAAREVASQELLQRLLLARLSGDPGLRDLMPLLGLDAGDVSPTAPVPPGGGEIQGYGALLDAELNRCHTALRHVAGALGACPSCLGREPDCSDCHGTGTPGTRPIDEEAFWSLVRPLLDRLSAEAGPPQDGVDP